MTIIDPSSSARDHGKTATRHSVDADADSVLVAVATSGDGEGVGVDAKGGIWCESKIDLTSVDGAGDTREG